MNTYIKQYK